MGMLIYSETQVGWVLLLILGVAEIITFYMWKRTGEIPILISSFLLLSAALLFSTMRITVDSTHLRIRFGIGLIRKSFLLRDILRCRIVRNPWWYGWGIRLIPGGWLFNVSGFMAVEIVIRNGKLYRIGSSAPEKLKGAIESGIAKP